MKSEDELVEEVLKGNNSSFELLFSSYREGLLNMAFRMTGNLEEAKEICQEAIIKTYKYLRSFKRGSSFKNWIYKIFVNSSYDFLRKKRKYEGIIDCQKNFVINESQGPEQRFLHKEIGEKIEHCLQNLSPKERVVFLLRDGEGFSIKEASKILGWSSSSVRTHLSNARRKIREQFEKIYPLKAGEVKG